MARPMQYAGSQTPTICLTLPLVGLMTNELMLGIRATPLSAPAELEPPPPLPWQAWHAPGPAPSTAEEQQVDTRERASAAEGAAGEVEGTTSRAGPGEWGWEW